MWGQAADLWHILRLKMAAASDETRRCRSSRLGTSGDSTAKQRPAYSLTARVRNALLWWTYQSLLDAQL